MPEKTEGQQLVDIFVATAHVNAEMAKALRESQDDKKKAIYAGEAMLDERGLSASDALDIIHGTDPSTIARLERLELLHKAGRPSLLEIAGLAFHTTTRESVTALVDGREITVTSLDPQSKDRIIQAPSINVDLGNNPDGVTGRISNYYSDIDRVSLRTALPIVRTARPRFKLEPKRTHDIDVAPVKRISKFTTQFVPQVAIDIQTPDQAA